MGERGPAKQPTQLRLLKGERRPSQINYREPVTREAPLEPPAWLPDRVRAVWDRTVAELEAMKVATSADRDSLVVYCQAVVHYEDACKVVNTSGILIKGRDGNVVKNPANQIVRDQAILIKTFAGQFGLTPSARAGLTAGIDAADLAGAERLLS